MRFLARAGAVCIFAVRRLSAQRTLALANLVGLACAVMLLACVPLYVDATFHRMLRQELQSGANRADRPPFAFLFHYIGSWAGALTWAEMAAADTYLAGPAVAELGLPRQFTVRSLKTDRFFFFAQALPPATGFGRQLGVVSLATITDLQEHITLAEGRFPMAAPVGGAEPLEVLVSEALANQAGLDIGATYVVFGNEGAVIQIPVRIAGAWRATDPAEPFWFSQPEFWQNVLFVPEATFRGALGTQIKKPISEAAWYTVMDGSSVRTGNADEVQARIQRVQAQVSSLLPKTLFTSPLEALQRYQRAAQQLTAQLYAFSTPLLGLDLLFIGLVAGMSSAGRRSEIAILRSRGVTAAQVVSIATVEAALIGLLALAVGLPAAALAASLAARTRGFLDFTAMGQVAVVLNGQALWAGVAAIGFGVGAQVLPAINAARLTIVSHQQERVRTLRPPWWQRVGLDLWLLAAAAYGAYQLRRQGGLLMPATPGRELAAADPFQNPLLLAAPFLAFLALTLLLVRVLPLAAMILARLAAHTRSVSFLLAVRQFARMPGFYTAPLVLTAMTLSLSVFIATTAASLDRFLYDQMRYGLGAEMVVRPEVEIAQAGETGGAAPVGQTGWYYVPLAEYLQVPGVQEAARVGDYRATLSPGGKIAGAFRGVDRERFGRVAYWRNDFARDPLETLMRALGTTPDAVLVPEEFLTRHGLRVGDPLRLYVNVYGHETALRLTIAGSFDLFPTWNPRFEMLFVGNLDTLHQAIAAELPATIWLALDPAADPAQVKGQLHALNPYSVIVAPSADEVAAQQQRPERQGLIGLFSVGFGAAGLLAGLGFSLYTLISLRRRTLELGVLRTMGLSTRQLVGYLAWEELALLVCGVGMGVGLGIGGSLLWIPHYRVGSGLLSAVLPLTVQIAWPAVVGVCALFGALFIVLLVSVIIIARRFRLSEAVKLLETL